MKNPKEIKYPVFFLKEDPITKLMICNDCWNGLHEKPANPAKNYGGRSCVKSCHCACREVDEQVKEDAAALRKARHSRKNLYRELLASSSLAVHNSATEIIRQDVG